MYVYRIHVFIIKSAKENHRLIGIRGMRDSHMQLNAVTKMSAKHQFTMAPIQPRHKTWPSDLMKTNHTSPVLTKVNSLCMWLWQQTESTSIATKWIATKINSSKNVHYKIIHHSLKYNYWHLAWTFTKLMVLTAISRWLKGCHEYTVPIGKPATVDLTYRRHASIILSFIYIVPFRVCRSQSDIPTLFTLFAPILKNRNMWREDNSKQT